MQWSVITYPYLRQLSLPGQLPAASTEVPIHTLVVQNATHMSGRTDASKLKMTVQGKLFGFVLFMTLFYWWHQWCLLNHTYSPSIYRCLLYLQGLVPWRSSSGRRAPVVLAVPLEVAARSALIATMQVSICPQKNCLPLTPQRLHTSVL